MASHKSESYYLDRLRISGEGRYEFVKWCDTFKNNLSKVVVKCCVDGFEWSSNVSNLINHGKGCPQCAGNRRWTSAERENQINKLENVTFVRWLDGYKNKHSKLICHCPNGHEWVTRVSVLLHDRSYCPSCTDYGYDPNKPATLYALRSECGRMVKIGISNNHKQRHSILKRKTPFSFICVELYHGDGSLIATLEKVLHDLMTPVKFDSKFDGSTEWREWDDRLPIWFEMYRSWS